MIVIGVVVGAGFVHFQHGLSVPVAACLAGSALVAIAGCIDDLLDISWRWRIAAQLFGACVILLLGYGVEVGEG